MWSIDSPSHEPSGEIRLSPERVLYSYDGPQIFTSTFGVLPYLFVKVEEEDEFGLFVACQISDKTLSLIVDGKLSLKSAFEHDVVVVIRANNNDRKIERYWTCLRQDFPEYLLPQSHIGLAVGTGRLPDSALQLEAYFAMGFRGRSMRRSGMPFSVFKRIIDSAYDAARKILAPPLLARARSATFDFQIARPQFGSLVVALEMPIVNEVKARKTMQRPEISRADIVGQIDNSRNVFFDDMSELVSLAERNQLDSRDASERFYLIDNIHEIIPSEENKIESLELNANIKDGNKYISIDEEIGNIIQRAHRAASNLPIRVSGPIFLINSLSRTFSILARHGREITCALKEETYVVTQQNTLFRTGTIATVTGNLAPRTRRDYLEVTGIPELSLASRPPIFD